MADREYDHAFFKVLSRNDTGETGAHQGGIVIPLPLVEYFPHLAAIGGPTTDSTIVAELYAEHRYIGLVHTRYQYQTWGRKRRPEHRLTRNLRPLLVNAHAGDIVRFERRIGEINRYRLTLLPARTREWARLHSLTDGPARWGATGAQEPATQQEFRQTLQLMEQRLNTPFVSIEPDDEPATIQTRRRMRPEAFRHMVRIAYGRLCALCGQGLMSPAHHPEVDAAHIIPRSDRGPNDPRNGLALCRTHHWAFDRYLWTIDRHCVAMVPPPVARLRCNATLVQHSRRVIRLPADERMHPAAEALQRHAETTHSQWGR